MQHVFGLIGSASKEIVDALYDASDIRFIGVHDERNGTNMADGYVRASGKADVSSPPFDQIAERHGVVGFRVERFDEVDAAVRSALDCNQPAVVDIAVDPGALYSFRRDSRKHRGG